MREYYGELSNCLEYVRDKNHKAIPWKDTAFSFELYNSTEYILELKKGSSVIATVKPKKKNQILVEEIYGQNFFVSAKEDIKLSCSFEMQEGCMVKRNLEENMTAKVFIAPVFKNGIVTIVKCNNCGPDLGKEPKYIIKSLKEPTIMVKICNFTNYDIIVSAQGTVLQKIEAKGNNRYTSKFVNIPLYGIVYFDTVYEEMIWKDWHTSYGDSIMRVNGCCIKVANGYCNESITIVGPGSTEPYIHHLYASCSERLKYEKEIEIWCNTIDYRID